MRTALRVVAVVALAAVAPVPGRGAELDKARFREHVKNLTADPHRLAGTVEGRRAGDYIEAQLRELPGVVFVQRFTFPQETVETCEIRTESGVLPLSPLAANGMQPSVTSRDGITGRLVYIGAQRFAVNDVLDWAKLVTKLHSQATAGGAQPGARLWRLLDDNLRHDLVQAGTDGVFSASLKARFAVAVDEKVLTSDDFYDAESWSGVRLRNETAGLAMKYPYGLQRYECSKLNRHLLEDAFPGEIARGANGKDLRGCIALADFDATASFVEVFRLGAKAVIFIGSRSEGFIGTSRRSGGRTAVSADLPRFYVSAADAVSAGLLHAEKGTLVSQVHWQKSTGRNLFLWVKGTDPVFKFDKDEYLIVSAPYDTTGVVPHNSPSPERAANCAALLETARSFTNAAPRRSVLFAFFDNHANNHQGSRRFYGALRRSIPGRIQDPLSARREYVEAERAAIKDALVYFAQSDIIVSEHELRDMALQRSGDEAKSHYNFYMQSLADCRVALHYAKNELKTSNAELEELRSSGDGGSADVVALAEECAALEQRMGVLTVELEQFEVKQKSWQVVRESIRDSVLIPADNAGAQECFEKTIAGVVQQLNIRATELGEIGAHVDDAIALTEPMAGANPTCHISYRFTAGSRKWLVLPRSPGLHSRTYGELLDHVSAALSDDEREKIGFAWESRATWEAENDSPDGYVSLSSAEACFLTDTFMIPALTLVTELDRAPQFDEPDAELSADALDGIRVQSSGFLEFLVPLANEEWASVPNRITKQRRLAIEDYVWDKDHAVGHAVRSFAYGDTEPNKIEPNVLVHIMGPSLHPDYYVLADGNGFFPLMPIAQLRHLLIEACKFDEDGRISAITTAVPGGGRASVETQWFKAGFHEPKSITGYYTLLAMFEGERGTFMGRVRPFEGAFNPGAFKMLQGLSDSAFKRLHFRFDAAAGIGFYQGERPLGVKLIYQDPKNPDDVLLYINSVAERATGVGFGPGNKMEESMDPLALDLHLAMAEDMFNLNESRLGRLRERNIILNFLEYLHSQSKYLLSSFERARAEFRHQDAMTHAATIASVERRVYRPVMRTTDDMVKAVTVLLILAVPFAFGLQCLLLPTYNVYRQIGGFIGFFAVSFAVLYFTHPAFAFSATPVVIILSFIIMLMSGSVIWVVSDRFGYEIKKMQGLAAAAHTFENRLLGNIGAAVSLAISIMQRRPVRTALTVVTVLLLTFTILSFVAFQSESGVNKFYKGPGEDQVSRLMFRHRVWQTLGGDVSRWRQYLRCYHDDAFAVHGRYWRTRELSRNLVEEDLHIPIRHASGGHAVAGAMMSLDEMEITRIPGIRHIIPADTIDEFNAGKGLYLSDVLAAELAVKRGETLRIAGRDLRFLGTFNSLALLNLRQIDGSPFMPVNFGLTRMAVGEVSVKGSAAGGADQMADVEEEMGQLEPEALEPVSPDTLIIVPTALAGDLAMVLKAVVVYPESKGQDLERLAEKLCVLNYDGVYLNRAGERTQYFYGEKYGMAGMVDVAIPLILGGLIVFSTMLGSIIDREKEIYTFSALGLAPRNIAMLFFVESAIYAVIGGFGGYLFSQVVARILETLAAHGIFKAPEMNYSSSTVINTILLVMATVLVSTIYPAIQAARKATADTTRRWHVPAPDGDVLEFDFPFTISRYDITGIICFIREHFANHSDRTVGKFAADRFEVGLEPEHGLALLRAHIWLQPFDQGISQGFKLTARPSDIEEVCEIHVQLRRQSGPSVAWMRSYRLFLSDLRSQFLLWRTLSDEAREHYLVMADEAEAKLGIETT